MNPGPKPNTRFWPWRKVVARHRYQTTSHPRNAWSVLYTLECGHQVHQKASDGDPSMKRCGQCPRKEAP